MTGQMSFDRSQLSQGYFTVSFWSQATSIDISKYSSTPEIMKTDLEHKLVIQHATQEELCRYIGLLQEQQAVLEKDQLDKYFSLREQAEQQYSMFANRATCLAAAGSMGLQNNIFTIMQQFASLENAADRLQFIGDNEARILDIYDKYNKTCPN